MASIQAVFGTHSGLGGTPKQIEPFSCTVFRENAGGGSVTRTSERASRFDHAMMIGAVNVTTLGRRPRRKRERAGI